MATPTAISNERSTRSAAQPRWATPRRPERPTYGPRWAKIAELLGMPFMPWQRAMADVAGEYDPETGIPFYREVDGVVMRQQGKTTLELAATVDRCLSWGVRQRCVYSAQTGRDARKKLLEDWAPTIRASSLAPLITPPRGKVSQANGDESIQWATGSFIELMASLEESGHGFSVHHGLIDEAWKDQDERREGAIRPAQMTIPDAQLWVVSTAGTDSSTYLKRKVEAGREAAMEDRGQGICYVEYSVPPDEDPFDVDVMKRWMPALCPTPGPCTCSDDWRHTVTQEVLVAEQQGMDADEYRRAFGNQWISGPADRVIPADLWDAAQDPTAQPSGRLRAALDVNEDRSSGAIAVSDGESVELVDHRPGTGWMVEAAKTLSAGWNVEIVVDGNGPAVPVAADLERDGVEVVYMSTPEVIAACGRIYDAVADGKVRVRPSGELDDAVSGLAKRPAGDRFLWSRANSTSDATPFVAATLAFGADQTVVLSGSLMA